MTKKLSDSIFDYLRSLTLGEAKENSVNLQHVGIMFDLLIVQKTKPLDLYVVGGQSVAGLWMLRPSLTHFLDNRRAAPKARKGAAYSIDKDTAENLKMKNKQRSSMGNR